MMLIFGWIFARAWRRINNTLFLLLASKTKQTYTNMSNLVILRRSIRIRQDGWDYPSSWVKISNVKNIVSGSTGEYLFNVDGIEYYSRSPEWRKKLNELQMWSKLQHE